MTSQIKKFNVDRYINLKKNCDELKRELHRKKQLMKDINPRRIPLWILRGYSTLRENIKTDLFLYEDVLKIKSKLRTKNVSVLLSEMAKYGLIRRDKDDSDFRKSNFRFLV